MLFAYNKRFDEALKRGAVYWPGETQMKFGLQSANIKPVMVDDGVRFEWGEVVVEYINSEGRNVGRKVAGSDTTADFSGIVSRNATATYSVLSEQITEYAPRLTISVFKGARDGVITVPVQNIGSTPVTVGGDVYVRVSESTSNPELPIGGIETEAVAGETVLWEEATFAEPVTFPFKDEKYTDTDGATTAVAGIEIN